MGGFSFSWFALANLWLTFTIIIRLLPQASDSLSRHIAAYFRFTYRDPNGSNSGTTNVKDATYLFYNATITHWVNNAFIWIYAATLGMQFILALGNRPKGEKAAYIASFSIFAVKSAFNKRAFVC